MTDDEYEYQEISTMDMVRSIVDVCEKQTDQPPCECIRTRVKELIDKMTL